MFNNIFPYTDFHELNFDTFITQFESFIKRLDSLESWKSEHEVEYQELYELYEQILSGNFPDSMIDALNNWMEANGADILSDFVKFVFFGITDDGYFIATIPSSWDDIIFGTTGYDEVVPGYSYGHLTLSY